MDQYRTEDEQVEALRRWWNDNGRSTAAAVILALAAGFGWQGWKGHQQGQLEAASDSYQAMLEAMSAAQQSPEQGQLGISLAEQIKSEYSGSSYARFAALHLARLAVENNDLGEAQAQLRWVLGKADKGSDTEQIARLRLARVLAASGDGEQALAILSQGEAGPYEASYAVARGDILLSGGSIEQARQAYTEALALAAASQGQVNLQVVQQKLQSLNPVPASDLEGMVIDPDAVLDTLIVEDEAAPAAALEE